MEFNVQIDEQDAQLILQALGELPIKVAIKTFLKVNEQLIAQQTTKGEGK